MNRLLLILVGGLVGGGALLLPALGNGALLMFPDSIGYYHAGEAALDGVGNLITPRHHAPAAGIAPTDDPPGPTLQQRAHDDISASRSVYYGGLFVAVTRIAGIWALPVVQAAIVLAALLLGLRQLAAPRPGPAMLAIVLLATLGGLGIFASAAMPDVFAGLLILALAIVMTRWAGLARPERVWWLGLILAACLFHKSNLALAAAMVAMLAGLALLRRASPRPLPMLAIVLGLALAAHAAVPMVVARIAGQAPVDAPFLLARTIGDGTAGLYLRAHCPEAKLALCAHVDHLPTNENDFLWSPDPAAGLMKLVPDAERHAIIAEADTVAWGAIREFPAEQARASMRNIARQLVTVGATQYALGPYSPAASTPALAPLLRAWPQTAIGRGVMPLRAISAVMAIGYAGGFIVLGLVAWRLRDRGLAPAAWMITGVVLNAVIVALVAGVFDRYQGRVAWLVPLAAASALAALYARDQGRATNPAARSSA